MLLTPECLDSGGVAVSVGWWHTVYSSAAPEAEFKATVILHTSGSAKFPAGTAASAKFPAGTAATIGIEREWREGW